MARESGKFKRRFNHDRGFGFIAPDFGAVELFCHISHIHIPIPEIIESGQRCTYEVIETPKGLAAIHVEIENGSTRHD